MFNKNSHKSLQNTASNDQTLSNHTPQQPHPPRQPHSNPFKLPANFVPMRFTVSTEWKKYDSLETAKTLLKDIKQCSAEITVLDLSNNTYVPEVAAELAAQIRAMPRLKEIRLESIVDTLTFEEMSEVVAAIADALPRTLAVFAIPSNALSCRFPEALARLLRECPLQKLDLYNCGLGAEGAERIITALGAQPDKRRLVAFDISKNRINRLVARAGTVLSMYTALQDLRLRSNTIEEASMAAFFNALALPALACLDVSDNFVCGTAIAPLCALLAAGRVAELGLQDTKMDDGDIDVVLRALIALPTQELPGGVPTGKPELVLDISCIYAEQTTVPLLVELSKRFALRRLVLFENSFEDLAELRACVAEDGGVVVEEEEEEEGEMPAPVDPTLIERIKNI